MTDYDKLSVHDFVVYLDFPDKDLPTAESALRRAVIRESTLATVTIKTHEYEDELTAPVGSPDRIVTMSQSVGLDTFVPDGEYALVAREGK